MVCRNQERYDSTQDDLACGKPKFNEPKSTVMVAWLSDAHIIYTAKVCIYAKLMRDM